MRVKWHDEGNYDHYFTGRVMQFVMSSHGRVEAVVCKDYDPSYTEGYGRIVSVPISRLLTDPPNRPA